MFVVKRVLSSRSWAASVRDFIGRAIFYLFFFLTVSLLFLIDALGSRSFLSMVFWSD